MKNMFLNKYNKALTNKKTMSIKDKIRAVLCFQKGYRLVSCVVWFLLFVVVFISNVVFIAEYPIEIVVITKNFVTKLTSSKIST